MLLLRPDKTRQKRGPGGRWGFSEAGGRAGPGAGLGVRGRVRPVGPPGAAWGPAWAGGVGRGRLGSVIGLGLGVRGRAGGAASGAWPGAGLAGRPYGGPGRHPTRLGAVPAGEGAGAAWEALGVPLGSRAGGLGVAGWLATGASILE